MKFSLSEFNHVRYGRGADAARVDITEDDGEQHWLWMSKQDIRKNVMLFGPHIGLLDAASAYSMMPDQLVKSWRASGDRAFLKPMEPARNREGWWTHPDWPSMEDGEAARLDAWLKLIGYETALAWMLEDDSDDASDVIARWVSGETDILAWEPATPAGEGWQLVSIHDNDDGPVAVWVRDKLAAAGS